MYKLLFFYFCINAVFGQTLRTHFTPGPPLYIFNDQKIDIKKYCISPKSIKKLIVLKDASTIAPYGAAGASGVVKIFLKKKVKLLQITGMKSDSLKDVKYFINDKLIEKDSVFFLDPAAIDKIDILKSNNPHFSPDWFSTSVYIRIKNDALNHFSEKK